MKESENNDNFELNSERNEEKLLNLKRNDQIDEIYGFNLHSEMKIRTGWLINMKPTDTLDSNKRLVSAMIYYFMEEDGFLFKSILIFRPYFYIATKLNCEIYVTTYLQKKYNQICQLEIIEKEDLDLDNHLIGIKNKFIKLSFYSIDDLIKVRKELMPIIRKNKKIISDVSEYNSMLAEHFETKMNDNKVDTNKQSTHESSETAIIDIREYDVPYHVRVSIDTKIFVGKWYDVIGSGEFARITPRDDIIDHPEPVVLAYDIETTKLFNIFVHH